MPPKSPNVQPDSGGPRHHQRRPRRVDQQIDGQQVVELIAAKRPWLIPIWDSFVERTTLSEATHDPSDEFAIINPFWRTESCRRQELERLIMRIVVVGGTGLAGSKLLPTLPDHGHDNPSNSTSFEKSAATDLLRRATGNLLMTEAVARVEHHVALGRWHGSPCAERAMSGKAVARDTNQRGTDSLSRSCMRTVLRVPHDRAFSRWHPWRSRRRSVVRQSATPRTELFEVGQ